MTPQNDTGWFVGLSVPSAEDFTGWTIIGKRQASDESSAKAYCDSQNQTAEDGRWTYWNE